MHFLVCPIAHYRYKLPDAFTYLAIEKALYEHYQHAGWSILEYRESVGQLHQRDAKGKPVQGLFACLLAQRTH